MQTIERGEAIAPCHRPASQGRKGRCRSSIGQSQAVFLEHGPRLAWTRGTGAARALSQQRCSRLEIPSSLAWCSNQRGFLNRLECSGVPAQPRQHRRAWPNTSWAGGFYLLPLSPSPNRDCPSSWHSDLQHWHYHLLLLPGREPCCRQTLGLLRPRTPSRRRRRGQALLGGKGTTDRLSEESKPLPEWLAHLPLCGPVCPLCHAAVPLSPYPAGKPGARHCASAYSF